MKKIYSLVLSVLLLVALMPNVFAAPSINDVISANVELVEGEGEVAVSFIVTNIVFGTGAGAYEVSIGNGTDFIAENNESIVIPKSITYDGVDYIVTSFSANALSEANAKLYFMAEYNSNFNTALSGKTAYYYPENTSWASYTGTKKAVYILNFLGSDYNVAEGEIFNTSLTETQNFKKWISSNGGTFLDETMAVTAFTMPANNTTITAEYKENQSVTFAEETANFDYDGSPVSVSDFSYTKVGTGLESVKWYDVSGTELIEAPTDAGSYQIGITLLENDDYIQSAETKKSFTIVGKEEQSVTFVETNFNFLYNNSPVGVSNFSYTKVGTGIESVKWYDENGVELSSAPINAGSYQIGITLLENDDYAQSVEAKKSFTIAKISPSFTFDSNEVVLTYDGNPATHSDFTYTYTGGKGLYVNWYKDGVAIHAPTEVGDYEVGFFTYVDENYTALAEVKKSFKIVEMKTIGVATIDLDDKDGNQIVSANDVLKANTTGLTSTKTEYLYQWKLNGVNIDGATNSTYTVPSSYTHGEFQLIITAPKNYTGTHETALIGSKEVPVPPSYNILSGQNQTVAKNNTLHFKTDIWFHNFAGIWVDGISRDVALIATTTEGFVEITLKESFINSLETGEHLISFLAKDGGITSTYFTVKSAEPQVTVTPAPAATIKPTATPQVTAAPVEEIEPDDVPKAAAPETDSSKYNIIIPIGIVLIGILAILIVIIIRKRM